MRTHTRRHRHTRPGIQHLWGFDNGHVASAVPDGGTEHLWELTILDGNGASGSRRVESSDHEVLRALRPVEVRRILRQVEARR